LITTGGRLHFFLSFLCFSLTPFPTLSIKEEEEEELYSEAWLTPPKHDNCICV